MFDEFANRHPGTLQLLAYFSYSHLPEHLQKVSKPVGDLALEMVRTLPDSAELTAGLRKLLEAKDCLVRCQLEVPMSVGLVDKSIRD